MERRKDTFVHDRAKEDWSDATGSGRETGKANGSCGMLMACSCTFALYLRVEPITANSTAIY